MEIVVSSNHLFSDLCLLSSSFNVTFHKTHASLPKLDLPLHEILEDFRTPNVSPKSR